MTSEIRIDKDGVWYYRGAPMINREIVRFLYQHLDVDDGGAILIRYRGQSCPVDIEDSPFVVERVFLVNELSTYDVLLNDNTVEALNPETLWIDEQNIPRCRVKQSRFNARFSRKGYYELATFIRYDPCKDTYYLPLGKRRIDIQTREPWRR